MELIPDTIDFSLYLKETDAQIAARGFDAKDAGNSPDRYDQDFDPLEMDRYSRMQELSRALVEAVARLLPIRTAVARVWLCLAAVPLVGSLVTEPAAMTLASSKARPATPESGSRWSPMRLATRP